jgi:Arc/MetJ-type ribon-helix-helix transcriptional regulator
MKIITINLPEKYLDAIQTLNDLGIYPSRSEAIRIALGDFLEDELKMYHDLDDESFKVLMKNNINKNYSYYTFLLPEIKDFRILDNGIFSLRLLHIFRFLILSMSGSPVE